MDKFHAVSLGRYGFPLSLLALLILVSSGVGTRLGLWNFRAGFVVLQVALGAGLCGAALSAVAAFNYRGMAFALGIVGIVLGVSAAWVPFGWYLTARRVPAIHDITTDTADPPLFEAVLAARKDAANPSEYGGPEVAELQRKAYPDVVPLLLPVKPETAFKLALEAAKEEGWEIARADPAKGMIEATDTTFWFGFKDDIAVRVRQNGEGARIDVRSLSRVGRSDVGTNARRVERYLAELGRKG